MNAAGIRMTPHWRVWVVDDPNNPLHLLFTPLAGDRVGPELMEDERADLHESIAAEIRERGLSAYELAIRVDPGVPIEAHLTSGETGRPCPGIEVTGPDTDMRFVLDLADAVRCPLCGHRVARWQIVHGVMGHEPGE